MHFYRRTITLFGIVMPVTAAAVLIGGAFYLKTEISKSYQAKKTNYKTYDIGRLEAVAIEGDVTRQRKHLDRWNSQLSQETASTVTTNLREISEKLPSKEIQLSAFDPSSRGGIGQVASQESTQIRIALRGTYRTMQRALLELETRMPQLQLQELRMDASTSQSSLINFQVTYTAWEN